MSNHPVACDLRTPKDLEEALQLLGEEDGGWKPFAGGTDLMVTLEAGTVAHKKFLNIWNLPELKGIEVAEDFITLGALTTYSEVLVHETIQREFPLLRKAAGETGGVATQNRGTLGGNIANASPAADSPPALLVYEAELNLVSARGFKWVPYEGFHTGYKEMRLQPDELIRAIRLPRLPQPVKQYYRKVGTRKAQAIAKVCFAGLAEMEGNGIQDVRIALGSVAPTVVRCRKTEAVLKGQPPGAASIEKAKAALAGEISPIDDIRSTAKYRLRVAQNLLGEFLEGLTQNEGN